MQSIAYYLDPSALKRHEEHILKDSMADIAIFAMECLEKTGGVPAEKDLDLTSFLVKEEA